MHMVVQLIKLKIMSNEGIAQGEKIWPYSTTKPGQHYAI